MKISIKLFLQFFLFSLPFLISCKDSAVDPTVQSSFYPINIGNKWEYQVIGYDSLGNLEYQGNFYESFIKYSVLDSLCVYEIQSPLYHSPACCDYNFYFQNKKDGVYFLTYYLGWIDNNLIYKYPCSQNDFYISSNHNDTTFVISLEDTVICEAGKFSCIVYKNIFKDISDSTAQIVIGYSHTYVSRGIGKIKYESYSINSNKQFYKKTEYSLKNYNLH